jgi:ATP-dependent Zn protease
VDEAHEQAVNILIANPDALDAVAAALLHDESLDRDRFAAIVDANRAPAILTPIAERCAHPTR